MPVGRSKGNAKKAAPKAKTAKKTVVKNAASKKSGTKGAKASPAAGKSVAKAKPQAKKTRIGVFFGGRSSEHEVSLVSAKAVMNAIDRKKYEVVPVGITKDGNLKYLAGSNEPAEILKKGHYAIFVAQPNIDCNLWIMDNEKGAIIDALAIDLAFPVLHGPYGEDGKIQGMFEMAGIPYVGSDVLGSACGMDKTIMKNLFVNHNLPTPNYAYFTRHDFKENRAIILETIKNAIKAPYFVKPANLGSSVGISKVPKFAGIEKAIAKALEYDYKVIVEEGVDAREIEVAIVGNFEFHAAEPGEIVPAAEFYDYDDKYKNGKTKFHIPAKLSKEKLEQAKELAVAAYEAVCARGFARVDLFLDKKSGEFMVNEINTIPGFTSISMFPKMFESQGLSYAELVDVLIGYAVEMHETKKALKV